MGVCATTETLLWLGVQDLAPTHDREPLLGSVCKEQRSVFSNPEHSQNVFCKYEGVCDVARETFNGMFVTDSKSTSISHVLYCMLSVNT